MKVVIVSCFLAMLMAVVSAQPNLTGGVAVNVDATQMAQKVATALATIFKLPSTVFSFLVPILSSVPTFILQIFSTLLSAVSGLNPISVSPTSCTPCTTAQAGNACIGGCLSLSVTG